MHMSRTFDTNSNLRILMHKAREHQQPRYMCFVDFNKAFDWISLDKLWVTMMDIGYPLPGLILSLLLHWLCDASTSSYTNLLASSQGASKSYMKQTWMVCC